MCILYYHDNWFDNGTVNWKGKSNNQVQPGSTTSRLPQAPAPITCTRPRSNHFYSFPLSWTYSVLTWMFRQIFCILYTDFENQSGKCHRLLPPLILISSIIFYKEIKDFSFSNLTRWKKVQSYWNLFEKNDTIIFYIYLGIKVHSVLKKYGQLYKSIWIITF